MEFLRALVDPAFMPHGHCYYWRPELVWLQVVSNLAIGAAYLSISLTLFYLSRKMKTLPFRPAYLAFGAFIVLCGFTHVMDIVTVWRGVYWLDGGIRALTAVASVATALWLFPLFPRVVGFGRLIAAERELSRAKLEESERLFRELIDNLPQLAWSARPDGYIDYYNQRWFEYTGTTAEQMEGWGWRDVHDPNVVDTVESMWRASITSGLAFEMEFRLRAKDGRFGWFLTRVTPLRNSDGKITRWVGTNTNIDDQRRARADLVESVRLRDEFLSIASHELRTPLQSLVLQLELTERITRGEGQEAILAKLKVATKHVDRLAALIDQMLDVSTAALGRLALDAGEVDLVANAREVIEAQAVRAEKAGSEVRLIASSPVVGRWDRSRIDQVLTNLIGNAIKYGEGKPIDVAITTDGTTAEIAVSDRGIGIDPADHDRVFGRFERGVSRNLGGLGLGLYIAREIVRAHGGTLAVVSKKGEGARFTVRLPLHPVTDA